MTTQLSDAKMNNRNTLRPQIQYQTAPEYKGQIDKQRQTAWDGPKENYFSTLKVQNRKAKLPMKDVQTDRTAGARVFSEYGGSHKLNQEQRKDGKNITFNIILN